jgi:hypothetical protein
MKSWLSCGAAVLLWLSAGAPAQAGSVAYYRYNLYTCGPVPEFAEPVSPGVSGTYYGVERDTRGRVVALAVWRNGRVLTRRIYHYSSDQQGFSSTDEYTGTVQTGRTVLKYNADGFVIRVDYFDAAGARTGYVTVDVVAQGGTKNVYTAEGRLKTVRKYHCSVAGRVVAVTEYERPDDRGEYMVCEYNENTALNSVCEQYWDGKLDVVISSIYGANGDQTSMIASTADGTAIATEEYSDARRTLRRYVENSSTAGLELRDHYNEKEWRDEVAVYYRGTFVCRLKYEMTSDGTVQKTLALGPDGSLWAEYPDHAVYDIDQQGTAAEDFPMVRYKTGNWW